jgi:hypothetical protein
MVAFMNSKLLILAGLAAVTVTSIAVFLLTSRGSEQSGEGEEAVTEFAPVRAYAGFSAYTEGWPAPAGTVALVGFVGPGTPAELAGLQKGDVVRRAAGTTVTTSEDVLAEIERYRPGDSIELEVERYVGPFPPGGLPEPQRHTVRIDLVEEPVGTDHIWVPYTRLEVQDQLRLGIYLAEITEPLAQHFGIEQPGGVLVYNTLPRLWGKGPADGDVILSFNGESVASLSQLQDLVDMTPEDKPISVSVRRGDQTLKVKLDSLGPSVPGVNHMSAEARERLRAALDRGDLHADHLQLLRPQSSKPPNQDETRIGFGAISKLSGSSITIELFDTGGKLTLAILPSTRVAGYGALNGLADLNVGEFVEVISRNDKAEYIYSKSAPLRPP